MLFRKVEHNRPRFEQGQRLPAIGGFGINHRRHPMIRVDIQKFWGELVALLILQGTAL
jgi:hypothetical protein